MKLTRQAQVPRSASGIVASAVSGFLTESAAPVVSDLPGLGAMRAW
jgi:hypothetical protein